MEDHLDHSQQQRVYIISHNLVSIPTDPKHPFSAMPNSPSLTRITVFPTSHNGSKSPSSHEVSVAIIPTISRMPPQSSQQHNVIITELASDTGDDDVDFNRLSMLNRQNSEGASSVQHAVLRQQSPTNEAAISTSAPSTLSKAKPEQKTGEVYV